MSVIVTAYNIEHYIGRCLESLVNQTLKDIEIIVVNDGSTDKTCLKIEKFLDRDKRVVLINQQNKGVIEARKSGLTTAKGEYILFVDGDDWLEQDALKVLYDNAKKNNSDIVLYQAFKSYDDKKDLLRLNAECEKYSIEEILLGKISPSLWSKFIKIEYIKSNTIQFPSDVSFAEDLATVISLFMHKPKVSIEDNALYNYYIRLDSLTNKINSKVLDINDSFIFIKKILYNHEVYAKYKECFEYCVWNHIFFTWCLRYVNLSEKYGLILYKKYKDYNIDMNHNPYIREKISNCPLSLRMRVTAYHHSYKLGKLYDNARSLFKRG